MLATTLALFLLGLASGLHCAGMCGGFVAAIGLQPDRSAPSWQIQLTFNLGRILLYALLGGVAGLAGGAGMLLDHVAPVQAMLRALVGIIFVAVGLHLLGFTRLLRPLERLGYNLWQHLRPLSKSLLPANTLPRALAVGALWGLLPCGLVYSALMVTVASANLVDGMLQMLAFALGTLPNLMFSAHLLDRLGRLQYAGKFRSLAGVMVLVLGVVSVAHTLHTI